MQNRYLVLELVDGTSLEELRGTGFQPYIDEKLVIHILTQLLETLESFEIFSKESLLFSFEINVEQEEINSALIDFINELFFPINFFFDFLLHFKY